jgi:hypothetical protein
LVEKDLTKRELYPGYAGYLPNLLAEAALVIVNGVQLQVLLEDGRVEKFKPLKIFYRNGYFYLYGLNRKGEEDFLSLEFVKRLTPLVGNDAIETKIVCERVLHFRDEEPFLFGIAFHKVYMQNRRRFFVRFSTPKRTKGITTSTTL